MALDLTPPSWWVQGTEPQVPWNENFLRWHISQSNVNNSTTAQPGSPADGDCYIIQSTHTGTQWTSFTPKSIAVYFGGTWYEFKPKTDFKISVGGVPYIYTGGAWTTSGAADRGTVSVLTPASGVVNIDCSLGDYFTLAPTANVTSITFSNLPASGKAVSLMIRFTQDTTARTVAWPASFKWAGGVAGAVSTGSGAIDVIGITTFNQGTTWAATIAKAFA